MLIDPNRSACLCEGDHKYTAAVLVDTAGGDHLVLLDRGDDSLVIEDARHEQRGPLPSDIRARLGARCHWCAVPLQQPDSIDLGVCGECRFTFDPHG